MRHTKHIQQAFFFGVTIFLVVCNSFYGMTQHERIGTWNLINVKYTFNEKWSFFSEAQIRSLKFYDHFHYHEYKAAMEYKANSQIKLTLGAGKYDTYKEGGNFVVPKNTNEFRVWPQLLLIHPIGKLRIEHRYRTELRFTTNGYRNRYRYRLALSYALGKPDNGNKPLQLSLSNELFFSEKEPYFERNRLLFSVNYKISSLFSIQMGYLHQFDYKINDETGRDFFLVGLFLEIHKHKSEFGDDDIKGSQMD